MESLLQGGPFRKLLDEQIAELRRKYGLKKAELEILYFLSKCEGHNTGTDIHCGLWMNKGHISQAVDSLCKRGLLAAVPDKEDRRYIHYEISESAREMVKEMAERREQMYRKILEGISEEELNVFQKVSARIRDNIEKMI